MPDPYIDKLLSPITTRTRPRAGGTPMDDPAAGAPASVLDVRPGAYGPSFGRGADTPEPRDFLD
jgi:hypothetical protein